MDRLLTRGHGLFPAGGPNGGGVFAAGGGGGGASVPEVPSGGSGLGGGVATAGGQYSRARAGVVGLDVESGQAAGEGGAVGASGRAGAGVIRDQARVAGAAAGPLGSSPAGVRMVVATMDEHLAAMQRQLQVTTEQNRVLATRLRQLAMAYRGIGGGGMGGLSSMLSGMGSLPSLGGGGGGLSGLSGLVGLPTSLMGRGFGRMAGTGRGGVGASGRLAAGAAGVAQAAIPVSEVSFEGKGVWAGGREAVGRYLEEALDRMGISDPRARAHWIAGMTTIAEHESGFRTDAINLIDTNAHGARQTDGGPQNSSRGVWQLVPGTFAHYHQPGTSNHIWDPVANACASMNYQMARYGVAADGHNQRALVGQANPGVHRGY